MSNFALKLSLLLVAGQMACVKGPGLFQKDGASEESYEMISSTIDGGVAAEYDPSLNVAQTLAAGEGTAIEGASVTFPAGALAIGGTVRLEEGASLASGVTASSLGVNSVNSAGPSVVLSSSLAIDGTKPFTLSVPRSKRSSLALASEDERLIIVYRVFKVSENKYFTGVYTLDQLKVSDSEIKFETTFFGAYQAVISDTVIKKAVAVVTTTPVITAKEEQVLEAPEWTIGAPVVNETARTIAIKLGIKKVSGLEMCAASVYEDKNAAPISTEQTKSSFDFAKILGSGDTYNYTVRDNNAHNFFLKFSCVDSNGRTINSPWSTKASIAKAQTTQTVDPIDTPDTSSTLEITGYGRPNSSAPDRRIDNTADDPKTISGVCDSTLGGISVHIDKVDPSDLTISCTNNAFSFTINSPGHTGDILIDSSSRGYGITLKQQSQQISTVIFGLPAGNTLSMITSASQLAAITGSNFYVLGNDITISTTWTPISSFTGVLDGDGFEISGLNISVSSSQTNRGMLGNLSGASIGHLTLYHPVIAGTISGTASNIGFLAGSAGSNCLGYNCIIAGVSVINGTITLNGGTPTNVGGLIGHADDPDIKILESDAEVTITALTATNVGAIAGGSAANIRGAKSSGMIHGYSVIGGLVGFNTGNIDRSSSLADVKAYIGGAPADANSGGLVGYHAGGSLSSSYATGDVSLNTANSTILSLGGLIGKSVGSVSYTYALGNVSGGSSMGGLIGLFYSGTLTESYATGNIDGGGTDCGGVIGRSSGGSGPALSAVFSTGLANCSGGSNNGGVIGNNLSAFSTTMTHSTYVQGSACVSGTAIINCDPTALADLKTANSSYYNNSNWNFSSRWKITGTNLPILQWE